MECRSSRFNITHPSEDDFRELLPDEFDEVQKLVASTKAALYFDKNIKEVLRDAVELLRSEALVSGVLEVFEDNLPASKKRKRISELRNILSKPLIQEMDAKLKRRMGVKHGGKDAIK